MKLMRLNFTVCNRFTNSVYGALTPQQRWYSGHHTPTPLKTDVDLEVYEGYSLFKEKLRKIGDGKVTLSIKNIPNTKKSSYAVITIDNTKKKNALSGKMMAELADAIERLDEMLNEDSKNKSSATIRAVVLKGHGDTFCSGSDLDNIRQHVKSPVAGGNMSK